MNAGDVRRALAIVALIVGFGACSGADDDAAGLGNPGAGAADEASGDERPDPADPSTAELEAALLRLDDLPGGLIELASPYPGAEICGLRTEMPESFADGVLPFASVAFAADDQPIVPDVFEKIVVAPAGAGAELFVRTNGQLDVNCNNDGEVDGFLFRNSTELAAPTIGEESVARRVTVEPVGSGTTLGIDLLYARAGDTVVAVGVVQPEGQIQRLVELATIAVDRATAIT